MTDDHQLQRWWAHRAHRLFLHTHTHASCTVHTTVYSLFYYVQQADRLKQVGTGLRRAISQSVHFCVSASACMHLFDVDWWRAVTDRKEDVSMRCLSLPSSLSALGSAWRWRSVCVCWTCVYVLALVGNDFEKRSTTPNSQYHPISPHWNQHGGVVIGRNVLLLQFSCAPTFFGTDSFPIREVPDDGWWYRFAARKVGGWASVRRVSGRPCLHLSLAVTWHLRYLINKMSKSCMLCNYYTLS